MVREACTPTRLRFLAQAGRRQIAVFVAPPDGGAEGGGERRVNIAGKPV